MSPFLIILLIGIFLSFYNPFVGLCFFVIVALYYYLFRPRHSLELGEGEHGSVRAKIKRIVLSNQGGRCGHRGCSKKKYLAIHHIVPRNMGGDNRVSNLVYLCPEHHAVAHDPGSGKVSYGSIPKYLRWNI